MPSCKFSEIFKKTYFVEHLGTVACALQYLIFHYLACFEWKKGLSRIDCGNYSCDKVQFSFGVTLSKDNLALAGSAKLSKLSFSLMLAFVQWKMDQKYDYDSKSSNKVDIFVFNFTFILARFWRKYCLLWQIWHRFCDLSLKKRHWRCFKTFKSILKHYH